MVHLAPMQPELRGFTIFDRLPRGCFVFPVTDTRSQPILRPGEFVVVDPTQRNPIQRELSVIQWYNGSREIVECWQRAGRFGSGPGGAMIDTVVWQVGSYHRPRSHEEGLAWLRAGRSPYCVDGPFATEGKNAGYLATKLVGRVVGILEPAFDERSLRRVG